MNSFFNEDEQPNCSTPYSIPGVINKDREDIKSFLDISNQFNEALNTKNEIYAKVLENKDFKGGKNTSEVKLKVDLLKEKVKVQQEMISKYRGEDSKKSVGSRSSKKSKSSVARSRLSK